MPIAETSTRSAAQGGVRARFVTPGSSDPLSICQEIRASLTVMFGAYRLVHGSDGRLKVSEQQQLLERAEHHALRAEALFERASRLLTRA